MGSQTQHTIPGPVVLVGSGEYLDVMNEIDSYLLGTLGGASTARVVLLPTASGLEPNGPTTWNNLGLQHFSKLGVKDIRATMIIDRGSASDPEQLALLREGTFYYFSGGNPQHIIDSLRDTPAWEIIYNAYEQGAVLAGCSAGAMMLSGRTISIRQVMTGGQMDFVEAMGIVPELIVFPHFDRMAGFLDQKRFQQILKEIPDGYTVVGIDEDTALVRVSANAVDLKVSRWQVMGRQSVTVFSKDADAVKLQAGAVISL